MLNAIEIRNPFLSSQLLDYVQILDVDSLLIGKHREMKLALRLAYAPILGEITSQPKLIARETMGAKQYFMTKSGNSPMVYRNRWKEIFGDGELLYDLIYQAKSLI